MFLEKAYRSMKVLTEMGFFVLVWIIAGAALVGVGAVAWDFIKPKADEVRIEAKISDKNDGKSQLTLKIGSIEKYDNLWVAKIVEPRESYSVGYRSSNAITRNLLITPNKSSKAHILFDNYKNKISEIRPLPEMSEVKVLTAIFIKNFNDSVDDEDAKISLMLISKDADKQKVIIEDADKILKAEMTENSAINVIYFKSGKLISAVYAIDGFKTISEPAVFDLKDTNLKSSELLMGK